MLWGVWGLSFGLGLRAFWGFGFKASVWGLPLSGVWGSGLWGCCGFFLGLRLWFRVLRVFGFRAFWGLGFKALV